MYTLTSDYQVVLSNILEFTHEYLDRYPYIKGFVIGISGGIDSALTTALARIIADDRPGFRIVGRALTIVSNKEDEVKRAIALGNVLCDNFDEVNLDRLFNSVYTGLRTRPPITVVGKQTKKEKIQRGNMKARIRMLYLYDLAHREDCIVLSTDNMTELQLGFWTLHGDVGDLGMIQSLFKTEVYGMAAFIARKFEVEYMNPTAADAIRKCAAANPTDGLGVSNSDLDQLLPGWEKKCDGDPIRGYQVVDRMLLDHMNHGKDQDSPVAKRHKATVPKRQNPINIPRGILLSKE